MALLFICAAFLILLARLIAFARSAVVNLLYWDQWDFYEPVFQGQSLWKMFVFQFGPHREGLGLWVTWAVANLSHWSSKAEAGTVACIYGATALLALLLKKRIFGRLTAIDAIIPCLFLTYRESAVLMELNNFAHGPLPVLLTVLYCLLWLAPNLPVRYALILAVNFLMIFTGFGLFMGLVTPLLLAFDAYRAWWLHLKRDLNFAIVAIVVAALSLASFFIQYTFMTAVDCFRFPYGNLLDYPVYMGLIVANFGGLKFNHTGIPLIGTALLALITAVAVYHLLRLPRATNEALSANRVIFVLTAFPLLFCLNTAIGRICLGMYSADAGRYVPYLMPAFLGLYFHFLILDKTVLRQAALAAFLVYYGFAAFYLTPGERRAISKLENDKQGWVSCYLGTRQISFCDARTDFQIYPVASATGLAGKLDYLRRNHLNLFAGTQ